MGVQRTSFDKLQRERNKKAKAAAKRERRAERGSAEPDGEVEEQALTADGEEVAPLSPDELLRMVALVHERFEAGKIGLEEFEEQKTELLARLPVD